MSQHPGFAATIGCPLSYSDWMGLKNEIETIRCCLLNFRMDRELLDELLMLRSGVTAGVAERDLPTKKPKSALTRKMEAFAVFGEYADREAARLGRLAEMIEHGQLTSESKAEFDEERGRNEAIAMRAIAIEAEADSMVKAIPTTLDASLSLFDGLGA